VLLDIMIRWESSVTPISFCSPSACSMPNTLSTDDTDSGELSIIDMIHFQKKWLTVSLYLK